MANKILNKIKIKMASAIAVTTVVVILGVISALNDFGAISFSLDRAQMVTILLLLFAGFEIGLKGFKSAKALPMLIGSIMAFTLIPLLIGFFGIVNQTLSAIAGVTKLLLVVSAVILVFTKD